MGDYSSKTIGLISQIFIKERSDDWKKIYAVDVCVTSIKCNVIGLGPVPILWLDPASGLTPPQMSEKMKEVINKSLESECF